MRAHPPNKGPKSNAPGKRGRCKNCLFFSNIHRGLDHATITPTSLSNNSMWLNDSEIFWWAHISASLGCLTRLDLLHGSLLHGSPPPLLYVILLPILSLHNRLVAETNASKEKTKQDMGLLLVSSWVGNTPLSTNALRHITFPCRWDSSSMLAHGYTSVYSK